MKRSLYLLSAIGLLLGGAVWVFLLVCPPEVVRGLGETASAVVYFSSIFALLSSALVLAFGERCLQFIGAVACVLSFLALAAFHSTHTHARAPGEVVVEVGN